MAPDAPVVAEQFDDLRQQQEADVLGMWAFLATELLIFGGLFTGYFAYRCWYPRAFEAGSSRLNVLIGGTNTIILLTSSLTMALAVYAARRGWRNLLTASLGLTALLGAAFLGVKAYEYYEDYREFLVPGTSHFRPEEWATTEPPADPRHVKLFLMFYYVMTGLHAVHLLIGIGLIGWLLLGSLRGKYLREHYATVDVIGLYWHFVDVVWIFLLPLLYLSGHHEIGDLHF